MNKERTSFDILFNGSYVTVVCNYLAMIPEIWTSPEAKTSVSGYRTVFALIGTITGTLLGAILQFDISIIIMLAFFSTVAFYTSVLVKEPNNNR